MVVEARVAINGSKTAVWSAITDIANASKIISGIQNIEIVEKPVNGLVGLRWRETRLLFGKPAVAEKSIIEVDENRFFKTKAEDLGFVFLTTMSISEDSRGIMLTSSHESKPQGFGAKIKLIPMSLLFKGVIKKAILQDLCDFKTAVELKQAEN